MCGDIFHASGTVKEARPDRTFWVSSRGERTRDSGLLDCVVRQYAVALNS
jgi:hypothetical protein